MSLKSLVCLLALVGAVVAQPQIVVEEPVWDLGTIPQHGIYKHDFIVKNGGDEALKLLNVIPSCQCAAALPDKRSLEPGDTAKISAEFKSLTFNGRVVKTITVVSNDPNKKNFVLQVKGDVIMPISVRPAQLSFGEITKNASTEKKEFTILTTGEVELDPKQVTASNPLLVIEPVGEKEALANGTTAQKFHVWKKAGGRVGLMHEKITINSSLPGPKIQLGLTCNVLGEIKLSPRTLNLGRIKSSEGATKELDLKKLGEANLEVVDVICKPAVFKATVVPVEKGSHYKIRVELEKGAQPKYYRGTVTVKTNVDGEELVTAYFHAFVSR